MTIVTQPRGPARAGDHTVAGRLERLRHASRWWPAPLLVVLLVVPYSALPLPVLLDGPIGSPGNLQLLALCLVFGALATGYDLLLGRTGLLSFGHALYFAAGTLDLPGAMFTASHNPARYNGIKLCRAGATPIGQDTGLAALRAAVEAGVPAGPGGGTVEQRDLLGAYTDHLRSLVDLSGARPLRVVVDAGNGMGGHTVPEVFAP